MASDFVKVAVPVVEKYLQTLVREFPFNDDVGRTVTIQIDRGNCKTIFGRDKCDGVIRACGQVKFDAEGCLPIRESVRKKNGRVRLVIAIEIRSDKLLFESQ